MSSEEEGQVRPDAVRAPDEGELNLTDPKAMRAMAHPVRMELLHLLAVTPTLTATQASEVLGESPANCAFHLRTLAKYGFVREAGGGKGRERPWTRAHRSISLTTTRHQDAQAEVAASTLSQVWNEQVLERIRRSFGSRDWPAGWEEATRASDGVRFLTAEEAVQVAEEIRAILDRYASRRDPASRPAGALPMEYAYYQFPALELVGLGGSAEDGGDHGDTFDENDTQHDDEDTDTEAEQ